MSANSRMKILIRSLYLLIVCSVIHSDATPYPGEIDSVDQYDVTSTLKQIILQVLHDYRQSYLEWENDNTLMDAVNQDILEKYSQLRFKEVTNESEHISIKVTEVEKIMNYDTADAGGMGCLFGAALNINTPIPNFRIKAVSNITLSIFSANYSYEVSLKKGYLSFTKFSELDVLGNEAETEIKISFPDVNIDIKAEDSYERSIRGLMALSEKMESLLLATVNKTLPEMLREKKYHSRAFSDCMSLKDSINFKHPNFVTQQDQHYYLIRDELSTNWFNWFSNDLKCGDIRLKGLWNLSYFNVKKGLDFYLLVENLEAVVNCSYVADGQNSSRLREFAFQIYFMEISGKMREENRYITTHVSFEPVLVGSGDNDASWPSILNDVVLYRIKQVIESSLSSFISYEYYYFSDS